MQNPEELLKNILSDIEVELTEEFDRNFERKAFFDKPWPKRGHNLFGGSLMIGGGGRGLRGSISASIGRCSITWRSTRPYAAIHNSGGKIPVTPAMRAHFWKMYYATGGRMTKLKSGKVSGSQRNVKLSAEAQFYKNMALTKKTAITIPQRQFIGNHPKVREAIEQIANDNLKEFCSNLAKSMRK